MIYRKLYVDGCVEVVCNALEIQGPLTLEQLYQTIQEKLPGSCVPKDNLKEDARLVILDDSSFTILFLAIRLVNLSNILWVPPKLSMGVLQEAILFERLLEKP